MRVGDKCDWDVMTPAEMKQLERLKDTIYSGWTGEPVVVDKDGLDTSCPFGARQGPVLTEFGECVDEEENFLNTPDSIILTAYTPPPEEVETDPGPLVNTGGIPFKGPIHCRDEALPRDCYTCAGSGLSNVWHPDVVKQKEDAWRENKDLLTCTVCLGSGKEKIPLTEFFPEKDWQDMYEGIIS